MTCDGFDDFDYERPTKNGRDLLLKLWWKFSKEMTGKRRHEMEKLGDGARKRPCVFDDVSTVLFAGFAKNPCVLQFILLEM